jgi:hypothetical protein
VILRKTLKYVEDLDISIFIVSPYLWLMISINTITKQVHHHHHQLPSQDAEQNSPHKMLSKTAKAGKLGFFCRNLA